MKRPKFDLVIEGVHFGPDGLVEWARGYERRGAAFSDRMVWKRNELIEKLRSGSKVVVGQRKTYWGNDFEVQGTLYLVDEWLSLENKVVNHKDSLDGVPRL